MLSTESDSEIMAMAKEEITMIEERLPQVEVAIKLALLPKDLNDDKNTLLEIRAAAGGDEAGLF